MRAGLAKVLIKWGRLAEARRERERVLDERDPENLADWTLKDTRDARILLDALKRKS